MIHVPQAGCYPVHLECITPWITQAMHHIEPVTLPDTPEEPPARLQPVRVGLLTSTGVKLEKPERLKLMWMKQVRNATHNVMPRTM